MKSNNHITCIGQIRFHSSLHSSLVKHKWLIAQTAIIYHQTIGQINLTTYSLVIPNVCLPRESRYMTFTPFNFLNLRRRKRGKKWVL